MHDTTWCHTEYHEKDCKFYTVLAQARQARSRITAQHHEETLRFQVVKDALRLPTMFVSRGIHRHGRSLLPLETPSGPSVAEHSTVDTRSARVLEASSRLKCAVDKQAANVHRQTQLASPATNGPYRSPGHRQRIRRPMLPPRSRLRRSFTSLQSAA